MLRTALGIVLCLSSGPFAASQHIDSARPPTIRLNLPQGIPSDTIHIDYFMTGPFGGYGRFLNLEKGRTFYEIVAAVENRPAETVKIVAYAPGCRIEALDIQLKYQMVPQQLSCVPLATKIVHGEITPPPTIQQPMEVEVTYVPEWGHRFFGIYDGPFAVLPITTAVPNQNGDFEVALPDFNTQGNLGEGEFRFTLREIETENKIALLRPADGARSSQGLTVKASYPPLIRFSSTDSQGNSPGPQPEP
ncbi:MAG: hypothetical protein ACLGSD_04575 [Acidobacteriota bacterium]